MTSTYRYWPRDKPIPDGWEHVPGALEGCHHGRHAILLREVASLRPSYSMRIRAFFQSYSTGHTSMKTYMKRTVELATAASLIMAAILIATGVKAADKSPAWTGIYVGASVGYGSTTTETGANVAGLGNLLTIDGLGSSGGSMGLKAGADLLVQQFLVGAFADWTHHDQEWSASSALIPGGTLASLKFDDSITLGGRAGMIVGDALVYGLVGYTTMRTSDITVPAVPLTLAVSDLKGWTLGGGIELALTNAIFVGLEYRHTQFDSQDIPLGFGNASLSLKPEMNEVRAALTYKFGVDVK